MTRFTLLLACVLVAVGGLLVLACLPAGCQYLRPACTVEGQRRCAGSSIEVCGGGRWTWALDCRDFNGSSTCAPTGATVACTP